LPASIPNSIPKIQADFEKETGVERQIRRAQLNAVKTNFTHAWNGYTSHAWLRDEVMPLSGRSHDPFGGWAATLVDSLGWCSSAYTYEGRFLTLSRADTLWIMGLYDDFERAVSAINSIDFSTCALDEINVFETTIRYLGGFLSAYDLSAGKYPTLLQKAGEIGDMLYHAFDTPNRMPITRWNFTAAAAGVAQEAPENVLVAELGSLTLEFTRLSQLTGDSKYYDAVQRIMDVFGSQQSKTNLPGMWPVVVNARKEDFTTATGFTIGGMADSVYEYLPKVRFGSNFNMLITDEKKQHILLGGSSSQYHFLFKNAMEVMKRNIFYRPMTVDARSVLLAGQTNSDGMTPVTELTIEPQAQHLGCFAGGMVGLAARIFRNEQDMDIATKLVEGCLWGYENMPHGIMPEVIHTVPCQDQFQCEWNEQSWLDMVNEAYEGPEDAATKVQQHHLPKGVTKVDDTRYILRFVSALLLSMDG